MNATAQSFISGKIGRIRISCDRINKIKLETE